MADAKDAKAGDIIIKKIKKGGGGHHGGAWKVAYADFVTAMMAFFLLLWLLSTTTPEQREGIAEYFTPTIGIKDSKGIGFEGGLTPNEKGASKNSMTQPGLVVGQTAQGPKAKTPVDLRKDVPDAENSAATSAEDGKQQGEEADEETFKQVKEEVLNAFEQTPELKQLKNQVIITNTPEGLKIDLLDDPEKPLFAPGSAQMTDTGRLILKSVGAVILRASNHVSVTAHTETTSTAPNPAYTNWELTADRANASRRYLSQNVVEPERITKVVGMADKELLTPKEPGNPRNRRITLMLLRNSYMMTDKNAPMQNGLLSVPKAP